MTIDELAKEVESIKARLDVLESGKTPKEGTIRSTPFGNLIYKNGTFVPVEATKPGWTPPISNTINEVPVVANIIAQKLAYIELPNGHKLWAAIHVADNKTTYQEVVPPVADSCGKKPAEGYFSLASSPKDLPAGTKYLRKEWNAFYLEKFPPTNCHPITGTWELEQDQV